MNRVGWAIAIGLCAWTACAKDEFVESTVAIHVLDQTGAPLSNAIVSVNSYTRTQMVDGVTDTNGVVAHTDRIAGGLSCRVYKDGYYETHGEIWGGPHKYTDHPPKDFAITLKKMLAPAPLVFRHIEALFIPNTNTPVAFDFEIGDWVAPHGTGTTKDVWMTAQYRKSGPRDYDIKITMAFSNALEGIQSFSARRPEGLYIASDLMPPQIAPLSGYTNLFAAFSSMRPGAPIETSWTANRNHIFQIRTHTNEYGSIIAANIGWLLEDIRVGVGSNGKIGPMFDYYFNPDSKSRSLEPLDADKGRRRRKP